MPRVASMANRCAPRRAARSAAPTAELARAIAEEWAAQGEYIEPAKMPLTRLGNTIIDGIAAAQRAGRRRRSANIWRPIWCSTAPKTPAPLRARQAQHWDPVLSWARQALGADFKLAVGVVHVAPAPAALDAAGAALADERSLAARRAPCGDDAHRLGADRAGADARRDRTRGRMAGGACRRRLEHGAVGSDEIALQRRGFRFAEFNAAALVLQTLGKY